VLAVFRCFDNNGHGTIALTELASALRALDGHIWTDERVSTLATAAGTQGDGRVQYEKFITWIFGSGARKLRRSLSFVPELDMQPSPQGVPACLATAAKLLSNMMGRQKEPFLSCVDDTEVADRWCVIEDLCAISTDERWAPVVAELIATFKKIEAEVDLAREASGFTSGTELRSLRRKVNKAERDAKDMVVAFNEAVSVTQEKYKVMLESYATGEDRFINVEQARELIRAQNGYENGGEELDQHPALQWMVGPIDDVVQGMLNRSSSISKLRDQVNQAVRVAKGCQRELEDARNSMGTLAGRPDLLNSLIQVHKMICTSS